MQILLSRSGGGLRICISTSFQVILMLLLLTPWVAMVSGGNFRLHVTETQCELVKKRNLLQGHRFPQKTNTGLKMGLRQSWSQGELSLSPDSALFLHLPHCFILPLSLFFFLFPLCCLVPRQLTHSPGDSSSSSSSTYSFILIMYMCIFQ